MGGFTVFVCVQTHHAKSIADLSFHITNVGMGHTTRALIAERRISSSRS